MSLVLGQWVPFTGHKPHGSCECFKGIAHPRSYDLR